MYKFSPPVHDSITLRVEMEDCKLEPNKTGILALSSTAVSGTLPLFWQAFHESRTAAAINKNKSDFFI